MMAGRRSKGKGSAGERELARLIGKHWNIPDLWRNKGQQGGPDVIARGVHFECKRDERFTWEYIAKGGKAFWDVVQNVRTVPEPAALCWRINRGQWWLVTNWCLWKRAGNKNPVYPNMTAIANFDKWFTAYGLIGWLKATRNLDFGQNE